MAERPVSTYDFSEFQFEGRTIDDLFNHYRWDYVFSWRGPLYTNMIIEFYSALQNVNTHEDEWEVYICGRLIMISPDALSTYLRIPRQTARRHQQWDLSAFDGAWIELIECFSYTAVFGWYDPGSARHPGFARDGAQHFTLTGEGCRSHHQQSGYYREETQED
ncbi:hypothetical protein CJ030_MR5G003469 [Morella rubra]|uniref:Uncharacterized protein n=1 Tax=Morella rubra TaxID=262757 RepID=A0A6A1VKQ7_9ROSI|nr:hypothetical protein CJ030_MR5G003469 [Morella rubra]